MKEKNVRLSIWKWAGLTRFILSTEEWWESEIEEDRYRERGRERKLCLFISFVFLEKENSRGTFYLEIEKYHPDGVKSSVRMYDVLLRCWCACHDAKRKSGERVYTVVRFGWHMPRYVYRSSRWNVHFINKRVHSQAHHIACCRMHIRVVSS